MPAYFRCSLAQFQTTTDESILARLSLAYANDGYVAQYTAATVAWSVTLPALREEFKQLVDAMPSAVTWQILLEYPLYRLRRRIDAVVLTPRSIIVLELKTGASKFESADKRQVEEYSQDLRDFHAASKNVRLRPILWALEADTLPLVATESVDQIGVGRIHLVGKVGLAKILVQAGGSAGYESEHQSEALGRAWDKAAYEPVPSVIEAATTLFAGHSVREISISGAKNLNEVADAVFEIIDRSRTSQTHAVVFLTGVPGAGKTLAGLNIVHNAVDKGLATEGDIVYLSGNTPLVVVLREALARDQYRRAINIGNASTMRDCRASTRATIQHINDFLKEYVHGSTAPPSGHVIVFDEAQRAWDARQGKEKFGRDASEPFLVLETMARHPDWSVTICLIGLGQEINNGEEGIAGWAEAIRSLCTKVPSAWRAYGPAKIFSSRDTPHTLGALPSGVEVIRNDSLHLDVPMRSFRSPQLGDWINALLLGDLVDAAEIASTMSYPLFVTRNLEEAKSWLRQMTLGERRMGLLASSGARRLRADGVGEILSATDGSAIAHWYLNSPGDIRSSFALEVPANEYTSQGLEIDFACLCWGGDLIHRHGEWATRALSGNRWNDVGDSTRSLFVLNSYRVLLSRAREGLVIWVPLGDQVDHTRRPEELDAVANALIQAGAHHSPRA